MTEAETLLADVHALRRQTRRARRSFEFPLLLFGVLVMLAPLCYTQPEWIPVEGGLMYVGGDGPFPMVTGHFITTGNPELVSWYWFLVIIVGSAATAWWYRRRAVRTGIESDTKGYLLAAGAALTAFLIGIPVLEDLLRPRYSTLYSTPAVNLPILFGSAALAAVTFAWCTRKNRAPALRTVGIFLGTLFAVVTFSALGAYFLKGFSALIIIAVGLLVLAWVERSALLAAIAVLFTAASIPANHAFWDWDFPNQFMDWWGWGYGFYENTRVQASQEVLVPGVILLAGGVVAIIANRRSAAR